MQISDFIKKQKEIYKKLKPCYCKAIQENVYFNSDGLNHLLYKNRRPRSMYEKKYRISLIKYLQIVISNAIEAKEISFDNPPSRLWVLEWTDVIGRDEIYKIKVILRKKGRFGKVHFLSVMRKKYIKKTKRPRI